MSPRAQLPRHHALWREIFPGLKVYVRRFDGERAL